MVHVVVLWFADVELKSRSTPILVVDTFVWFHRSIMRSGAVQIVARKPVENREGKPFERLLVESPQRV